MSISHFITSVLQNSLGKRLNQRVQIHPDGNREHWRDVPKYAGWYRVSNWGRIKSVNRWVVYKDDRRFFYRGKILNQYKGDNTGHIIVVLSKNSARGWFYVHRIVLEAFIGSCPEGMICRHFPDRNPANNRLDNICWGTPKENAQDKIKHGTSCQGETHGLAKLKNPAKQVPHIHNLYKNNHTVVEIAEVLNIGKDVVHKVLQGATYKEHQSPSSMRAIPRRSGPRSKK